MVVCVAPSLSVLSSFLSHSPIASLTEENNKEGTKVIEDGGNDIEKKILSYLNQRWNGEDEEDEEKEAALLSTLFLTLS